MTPRRYTVIKDLPDARDHLAAPPPLDAALPERVDLSAWLGPVKDQGQLGACTGFAFSGLREFLFRKFTAYELDKALEASLAVFSPLFLYYQERALEGDIGTDGGAQSRTGVKVLAATGVCLESSDPYIPARFEIAPSAQAVAEAPLYRIGAYHRVLDLNTLRSVLASGYVSSLGIQVYASFESDTVAATGTVPLPLTDERCLGGHEVLAFGYDDAAHVVMVRNSWGTGWGQAGDFTLPYEYFDGLLVMDMWTAHLGRPWS